MASSNSVSISSGKSSGTLIAAVVLGVLLGVTILVAVISKRRSSFSSNLLDEHDSLSHHKPFHSLDSDRYPNESHTDTGKDFRDLKSLDSSRSINVKALQSSPPVGLATSLSYRIKSFRSNDHKNHTSVKRSSSFRVASFVLSDLQIATSNFATNRLLGEGSIGRVYKAKYADGKVLAVKKINSSFFQDGKTEKFSEVVSDVTKLYHPNIVELIGYCSEQGHNMLVYDYFRNGSLHEFLHLSDEFSKPLTWNTRVRIALGTARAVEYLHETCSPPLLHNNIKSSNILLDAELNPRLSDCGFATFYQDTNQNVEDGYKAPECIKGSAPTLKSDVYSFGVVMLELLTGRMPFDSTKTRSEQYLVHWATPQLHDIDALGEMVDPALRGLYPPKSISRFADIIALCVQVKRFDLFSLYDLIDCVTGSFCIVDKTEAALSAQCKSFAPLFLNVVWPIMPTSIEL